MTSYSHESGSVVSDVILNGLAEMWQCCCWPHACSQVRSYCWISEVVVFASGMVSSEVQMAHWNHHIRCAEIYPCLKHPVALRWVGHGSVVVWPSCQASLLRSHPGLSRMISLGPSDVSWVLRGELFYAAAPEIISLAQNLEMDVTSPELAHPSMVWSSDDPLELATSQIEAVPDLGRTRFGNSQTSPTEILKLAVTYYNPMPKWLEEPSSMDSHLDNRTASYSFSGSALMHGPSGYLAWRCFTAVTALASPSLYLDNISDIRSTFSATLRCTPGKTDAYRVSTPDPSSHYSIDYTGHSLH